MTDIPEVAVEEPSAEMVERVAATIYGKPHCDKHPCEGCDSERKEARMHLMAIAPIIRAQVIQESVDPEGAKFVLVNGWLAREVDCCTCYGGGPYGHESGCGLEAELDLTDQIEEIRADEQRKALEKLSARVARKETEWDRQPGKHAAGMSHAAGKIRVYISEQIEKGKRP